MKTRTGFVSNSSSTSFIVAVPTTAKTCKCCKRGNDWMLEAMSKYLSTLTEAGNKMWVMTTQESVLEYFKDELENLVSSKKYAEAQLVTIESLEKDKNLLENFEKLKRQLERGRWKTTIPEEAKTGDYLSTPKKELADRKASIQKHLDEYDEKVKELKALIAKMQKYNAKDYRVYAFNIDNWATKAEEALKTMIHDNVAELIHKIVT